MGVLRVVTGVLVVGLLALVGFGLYVYRVAGHPQERLVSLAESGAEQQAEQLVKALGRSTHRTADGFVRDVVGHGARVYQVDDLGEGSYNVVFRVEYVIDPSSVYGGRPVPPASPCFMAEFDRYGRSDGPERADCPAGPPLAVAPAIDATVPRSYVPALRGVLTALPPDPTEADVTAALAAGVRPPATSADGDPVRPPSVDVVIQGGDIGVAYLGRDPDSGTNDCLFGSRVGGDVLVAAPPAITVAPGEGSCDGRAALARDLSSPH